MPSIAVTRKLAAVLVIDTFVVEDPAVRARVNNAHMMMLLRMLRPKQRPRIRSMRMGWEDIRSASEMLLAEVKRWMRCAAKVVVAVSVVLGLLLAMFMGRN